MKYEYVRLSLELEPLYPFFLKHCFVNKTTKLEKKGFFLDYQIEILIVQ